MGVTTAALVMVISNPEETVSCTLTSQGRKNFQGRVSCLTW